MADEGYNRSFPGNPNPPPRPPRPPQVSTATVSGAPEGAAPAAAGGSVAVLEHPSIEEAAAPKSVFRVVNNENGTRDVFMQADDLETTRLGAVNITGADAVLNSVAKFDPATQSWEVPEETARALLKGRPGFTENIIAKFKNGEANMARNAIGQAYLAGTLTREEATARGHAELLKVQLGEQPELAWNGLGQMSAAAIRVLTNPSEVLRFAAGEAAEQAPLLVAGLEAAARGAAKGIAAGGLAAAAGSLTGPVAPAAIVSGAAGVGSAYEAWKFFSDTEAGSTAIEMLEKGFDDKTVRELAPLAGIIKGTLETASFGVMTAPLKRGFIEKTLNSAPVKAALSRWYISYAATLGSEVSTELAQTKVDQVANNYAAQIEAKPELLLSTKDANNELWSTFVKTLAGTAVLGVPGAALDFRAQRTERVNTQAEIKAQEEMTARLSARKTTENQAATQETGAPVPQTTVSGSPEGTLQASIPKSPLPESVTAHPEFVKAAEAAQPHLEGVAPTDRVGVVNAYVKITDEHHDFRNEVMVTLNREAMGKAPVTPAEKEAISSKMQAQAMKMVGLLKLAKIAYSEDPLAAAAYFAEGVGKAPVDPFDVLREARIGKAPAAPTIETVGKSEAQQLEELGVQAASGKISPDELVAQSDKLMSQAPEEPAAAGAKRPAPQSFEGKTREVESKARVQALTHDLADVRTLLKSYEQTRERFLRNEMSTRLLDKQIDALITREDAIKADITFYEAAGKEAAVTPGETLSMKPATLENIVQVGFKEGRKEVIAVRAQQIKDIASRLELTQADIRLLLKDKNIGLMGDVEFRHFLDGFENAKGERVQGFKQKAAEHLKRKLALKDVRKTLKERQIKNEKNIRALHELPPAGKMTTKQLHDYVDILSEYEPGAIAITPKRVAALETSALKGAKTEQDIVRLAAGDVRVTPEEILSAQRGQFDPLRGDTELAESQPAYAFMVDQVQTAKAESDAKFQKFERENYKLGAAALASRGGIARRLVTTMPEVMAHLEADPGKVYTGEISLPDITPEEQAYVEFLRGFFTEARDYLFSTGELESTRFKDIYAPHLRRPVLEVLSQVRSAKELRAGLGEIVDGWMAAQKQTAGVEAVGPAVGLRQFFKQTLFRTGELTPSTNVIRSANSYAKQFYDKQAIDKALPVVDSLFRAVAALQEDQTKEGEMTQRAVRAVVADYLNNKKGIQAEFTKLAPRGGYVDLAVRLLSSWVTMKSIAFNLPLQITAPIGETAAAYALLQKKRFAKANIRLYSEQGRKIAEKYESFVGKGALDEVLAPGKNIDERALSSLFAILQWNRTRTLKTVLLGMMTDEEFAAGEISAKRLAEIKVTAGRLLDIPGLKSVVGSTSLGAGYTKFRGWLIPILRTTANDLQALMTPGRKMTQQEVGELMAIAETTLFGVGVIAAMGSVDDDDKTFVGQLRKKVAQEVLTLVSGWDPAMLAKWIAGGPIPQHVIQVGHALSLLVKLDEYKTGEKAGKLKGVEELKKTLPFAAAARQFKTEEK